MRSFLPPLISSYPTCHCSFLSPIPSASLCLSNTFILNKIFCFSHSSSSLNISPLFFAFPPPPPCLSRSLVVCLSFWISVPHPPLLSFSYSFSCYCFPLSCHLPPPNIVHVHSVQISFPLPVPPYGTDAISACIAAPFNLG